MKKRLLIGFLASFFLLILFAFAQEVEIVDGVRIVHNGKIGKWGKDIQVSMELIRTLGGLDVEDDNLAFNSPRDIVIDSNGNLYILDYSNNGIQKLNSKGEYISTLGQQGQGPGDLSRPYSMDIDKDDNLYILDSGNRRIQIINTEGEVQKIIKLDRLRQDIVRALPSGLIALGGRLDIRWVMGDEEEMPKLIELLDRNGIIQNAFGELKDYKDRLVNREANVIQYDVDKEGNLFLSFTVQNRIDNYSPEGKLVCQTDRVLNYDTQVIDKGFIKRDEGSVSIGMPKMNRVSNGIALDGEGRIWVITMKRQLRPEEITQSVSDGGVTRRIQTAEYKKMDMYKLEIFAPDGILLGEIHLDHLAHSLRIQENFLFIFDAENAQIFQYEIK